MLRALWDTEARGGARLEGEHYRLRGAARGPAPAHRIGLWIGAYKPRMLRLTGRLGDGWIPTVSYLAEPDLAAGNAAIDEAAAAAGRDPREVRRLLNLTGAYADGAEGPLAGPPQRQVEELARLALEQGISGFFLVGDDPRALQGFAAEVVPAVRELVAAERERRARGAADEGAEAAAALQSGLAPGGPETEQLAGEAAAGASASPTESPAVTEYERLGVTPTPDDGRRLAAPQWDESTRPHRAASGPEVEYTPQGQAMGQHLIDVHDHLRKELAELRDVVAQVRDGALSAGEARSALNEMALRQNDWTLGAFCSRYCRAVAQHHTLEDDVGLPAPAAGPTPSSAR